MKSKLYAGAHTGGKSITCYSCGTPGHKSNQCTNKTKRKWCKLCKSNTHSVMIHVVNKVKK